MAVKQIIKWLKQTLNMVDFETDKFEDLLKTLTEQGKVHLKILDFEYYSEERLVEVKSKKREEVILNNFESALIWRNEEKEILKYLQLKEEFKIKKSEFHFENGYLIYLHLGTEKNDTKIKEIIKKYLKPSPPSQGDEKGEVSV